VKGSIVITTGSFTGDAKREATRDGAPPIDLIDGDGLCELLKRYELGVKQPPDRWRKLRSTLSSSRMSD
jgi:restriction endonuclease Mrr